MVLFIPEWTRASGRDLKLRDAWVSLDDGYVVRRPLAPQACPVEQFVEHRVRGWLAVAVVSAGFEVLDPSQLFRSDERVQLEQRLQSIDAMPGRADGMGVLVLLWRCDERETGLVAASFARRPGMAWASRKAFDADASELVRRLSRPLPPHAIEQLLGAYFPETEIPPLCTTRRFDRDNRATLQRWFLDVEQEWAAKVDLAPPAEQGELAGEFSVRLVNGVAGSGKTLIAVQRALLLARLFPRQRIVVLIHNAPIVADLQARLRRVHGRWPPNVRIMTFFAWACRQWDAVFGTWPRMPRGTSEVAELVRHHRMRWPELKAADADLVDELDFINDALLADEAAYAAASRTGRRFALREADRARVWRLHEAVTQALQASGRMMWSALPSRLCLAHERHGALLRHDHILVDEAQFFAPSWFQLVKLSLQPQGQLFLCADPSQGFLKNRLSWKSAGLNVNGRTRRLYRSYRTTRALLEAAQAVLAALGAPPDGDDDLRPAYDGMEAGTPPALLHVDAPQDAVDRVVNEIGELVASRRAGLGAVLVLCGDNVDRRALYLRLCARLGQAAVWWFNDQRHRREPPPGQGGEHLRMASVESATGLEAAIVFLVGVEPLFTRGDVASLRPAGAAQCREEDARMLYMAMTRAGRQLVMVSSRRLPPEIERCFDVRPGVTAGDSRSGP